MARPLETLLVANRGEIACRIMATARRMGMRTVAVYSEADAGARHVAMADLALPIGPAPASESYLRADRIIAAAVEAGAQAIHPGYGFLSENPDFVEAVEAAGLIFVGPSAEAIRQMGLKGRAKALMEAAGVPVVPGYHGADQDDAALRRAAESIGFPVLIKAVAGGGGKGMRAVASADAFGAALAGARAEARAAFGNSDVLIEKLIETPRHIEVQVFGDGTRAVHLFERDCSLQRRHQKVLEEAPAPGMTDEMRAAMGTAAVRAAEAVGYSGAGTVEFIVDATEGLRPDRFWFMEMNTRLQVEHPVTEAIAGVDLVEWQLRVAMGERLPAMQEALRFDGHAIEVRLYAEDPGAGFLPATGRLEHLVFPDADVRVDTGVRQGDAVTPYYDPMIAKLTVHAETREDAFARLSRVLSGTEVAGTATNLAFLERLAAHPDVLSGKVDTGLIARHAETLTAPPMPSEEGWAVAVATLLGKDVGQGFTLWGPLTHHVTLGACPFRVTIRDGRIGVDAGDWCREVTKDPDGWRVDGRKTHLRGVLTETAVAVFGTGGGLFARPDPLDVSLDRDSDGAVQAPMPGLVTGLFVSEGDSVEAGAALATLEAMKMEHVLKAPCAGRVAEARIAVRAQVAAGEVLFRIESEGEGE